MTPEQKAREQINAMLLASGWVVQGYKAVDFCSGRGIALREVPLKTGPCDYLLPDQIRTILRTYRDVVQTELFPDRTLVPKTLIFAKDDSHAEDIVHLCREVFSKGNDFCKKITYQAKHPVTGKPAKGRELIKVQRPLRPTTIRRRRTRRGGEADTFCLSPSLRIAVTVDMICSTDQLELLNAA